MLVNGLSSSNVSKNGATEEERIVGGLDANPGKYPYLASMQNGATRPTFCGGALVAPQYVLRARHCFETDLNDLHVSFGMQHTVGKGSTKSEKIRVSQLFRHPKFNYTELTYDVALLKLETSSTRKLATLAAADGLHNKLGTVATAVGWGLVNNETYASTLQTVDVEIISDEECEETGYYIKSKTVSCAGI